MFLQLAEPVLHYENVDVFDTMGPWTFGNHLDVQNKQLEYVFVNVEMQIIGSELLVVGLQMQSKC